MNIHLVMTIRSLVVFNHPGENLLMFTSNSSTTTQIVHPVDINIQAGLIQSTLTNSLLLSESLSLTSMLAIIPATDTIS